MKAISVSINAELLPGTNFVPVGCKVAIGVDVTCAIIKVVGVGVRVGSVVGVGDAVVVGVSVVEVVGIMVGDGVLLGVTEGVSVAVGPDGIGVSVVWTGETDGTRKFEPLAYW